MKYDRFLGQVQHRAQLPSEGKAVSAIRATLETLAERLTAEEAKDLAAQLPREIAVYLAILPEWHAQRFSVEEFFQRVAAREPTHLPDAIDHARAVIGVLNEAVSAGEMRDVCAQLPEEFRSLMEPEIKQS